MLRINCSNDALFGIALVASGVTGLILSSDLAIGSATAMGPGYVPRMLGWLTVGLGALVVLRGMLAVGAPATGWALRPLLAVAAAIGLFMLVERTGLVLAVAGVTLVAALGDRQTRWREAAMLATLLAAFAALVFVKALGLGLPLWPAFLPR